MAKKKAAPAPEIEKREPLFGLDVYAKGAWRYLVVPHAGKPPTRERLVQRLGLAGWAKAPTKDPMRTELADTAGEVYRRHVGV